MGMMEQDDRKALGLNNRGFWARQSSRGPYKRGQDRKKEQFLLL